MPDPLTDLARARRMAWQRLESLQQAGVAQLPHADLPVAMLATTSSSPVAVPSPAPVPVAEKVVPIPADPLPVRSPEPTPTPSPVALSVPAATPPAVTPTVTVTESAAPVATADRASILAVLRQEVAACQRCPHLASTRTQTVFGVGNLWTRLCFFGEAPGADEDRLGEPFVGRAGQLLTDIIEKGMRLQRSEVYILNVLKCRPPENRTPTDDEIANCRGFFERQLEVLRPEFICCLGMTATKALLGPISSLGRARGKWYRYGSARVMVTYHPSYLLRTPSAKKDTWEDIQMLMREMGLPLEKN